MIKLKIKYQLKKEKKKLQSTELTCQISGSDHETKINS